MIPNELKSWREVMDDVARLTKERDEALAEIQRMRATESDELRAMRDDAIRMGDERNEARAEVKRLHAVYEVVANAIYQAGEAEKESLPGKAASFMEEARKALGSYGPKDGKFSKLAEKVRGQTWNSDMIREQRERADNAEAEVARLRASQAERAISVLEKPVLDQWGNENSIERRLDSLHSTMLGYSTVDRIYYLDLIATTLVERISALRAEAQAAPAFVGYAESSASVSTKDDLYAQAIKEPVPTEPAEPQIEPGGSPSPLKLDGINYGAEDLRWLAETLARESQEVDFRPSQFGWVRTAVRLLLDAEIARRGGAS